DVTTQPITHIDTSTTPETLNVLANAGALNISIDVSNFYQNPTFNVLGNSGNTSFQFIGTWHGGTRTVNVAANTGVVNVHDAAVGLPVPPSAATTQVNVGSTGSLADIHGIINLTNASGIVSLKIDDRFNPGPANSWESLAQKTIIGDLTINHSVNMTG